MDEILPFGGPRLRRSRNTKRRVSWRNYSFAYTNVWQLFDERREVWIGPAPIAEILAFRQRLYEHRYLIAEAADLGDIEAQKLMMLCRDVYTRTIACDASGEPTDEDKPSFAKLHIIPDPAIALVNKALQEAGMFDTGPLTQPATETEAKQSEIESIREQLKKTP